MTAQDAFLRKPRHLATLHRAAFALLLMLMTVLFAVPADAQSSSPFGGGGASQTETAREVEKPGVLGRLSIYLQQKQQIFYRRFAAAIRDLRTGYSDEAAFGLVLVAFLYGIFHAAGPGHGKAVISAYMLANERSVRRGIILAAIASLAQAVTAIVVTYGLLLAISATGSQVTAITANLEMVSFALVSALGAWMVWRAATPLLASASRGARARHAHSGHAYDHAPADLHAHAHDHAHAHGESCAECGHVHIPPPAMVDRPLSVRTALPIVASIGLRPCTGAVVVLVFAHTLGLYMAGATAAFAMSVGTAITVAAIAMLAVGSRELAARLFGGNAAWLTGFYRTVALTGALAVLALGLVLLHGSLTAPTRAFL